MTYDATKQLIRSAGLDAQRVTRHLLVDEDAAAAAPHLARAGGLTREVLEALGIDVPGVTTPEPVSGFFLPFHATVIARMRALLDELAPCWDDPVPFPATSGGRHTWELHPESTPIERARGYRRYRCTVCHAAGEEDSSG